MSAISTVMINKITPLKLHLASRTAQSGIINSSLINHGWLTNLFITNTLLNSSHLSTANLPMLNRTGTTTTTIAPSKLYWAASVSVQSGRCWSNVHLQVMWSSCVDSYRFGGRKAVTTSESLNTSGSQTSYAPESPGGPVKKQISGPHLQSFWFDTSEKGTENFLFFFFF